ncbi:MAG: glycosyltransferase [Gemmatimonadales bacterium]
MESRLWVGRRERREVGDSGRGIAWADVPVAEMPPPLYPDVGVIALVPDRWSWFWQPRHHVMQRLAAFFRVAWMHPAPEWRNSYRGGPRSSAVPEVPGLVLYDPPRYLPTIYRPAALARMLHRARVGQARRLLQRLGARRFVLYLWRPKYAAALETPHDLSVYHIDDDYSFDPGRVGVSEEERALIRRVDRVVIHSPGLMALKGDLHPRTSLVPNGVDYRTFSEARPEPEDLAGIPRPRIGYAGWLKPQLDWELLDRVATAAPDWSFVLVGPTKAPERSGPALASLATRPNVHFLGPKTPLELAVYPQHFDVCVMPYQVNAYTDCIYPLKLHEYLASGRPVVGSPIRSLVEHEPVIGLARTPEEWLAALGMALREAGDSEAARARQTVARAHDWWTITGRIAELIADGLGLEATERIGERAEGLVGE